jgi:twinkle protein
MSQEQSVMMTPIEYVVLKGWQYRKRGMWLDIKRCPFCNGGKNNDLHTFAIHSIDGNYICKRGSCNVASNFINLIKSFGDKPDKTYKATNHKPKITYVKPRTKLDNLSDQATEYLTNIRKFSAETIQKCGIRSDPDGNIVFTYVDTLTGNVCLLKFRVPRKHDPSKGQKAWRERGGKEVLWMLEKADPSAGPLVICLGEYDAMSCVEAGIPNATSVPSGDDSLEWIKNDWDELEKYSDIVIWADNDQSGQRAMGEIARRLGIHRVRIVELDQKDANATLWYLLRDNEKDVAFQVMRDMVESAPAYPFENLIRLVDVPDEQLVADGILSGIPELDVITGGFSGGGLTIWSGDNHAGKTTGVLGLCVIEPVQQKVPTFVYSGEMKKSKIKYWCELIASGPKYLEEKISKRTGRIYHEVNDMARWTIRDWYSDYVHLYDKQGGTSEENLFDAMEFAYKKHGCKNFVLDNLMIMILSMGDLQSEYHRQAVFTKHCKQFADDFDVHVHLVAHGKKGGDPNLPPTKSDIKGASEISNLADNAGAFWRVPESAKNGGLENVDNMLCWFKTRDSGEQANIKLVFDKPSKRMASFAHPGTLERIYEWENQLITSNNQFMENVVS